MAKFSKSTGYTFDDVVLIPQRSNIKSRSQVDISSCLDHGGYVCLETPIISANMDTITEDKMAIAMHEAGGLGILHRYTNVYQTKKWICTIKTKGAIAIPSIGISSEDIDKALAYLDCGASGICVDIAYANNYHALNFIEKLAGLMLMYKPGILIAGNVCTANGAQNLIGSGANIIKVGVGNGSLCTTRVVTGHGVPQLTALSEIDAYRKNNKYDFAIISDGGCKNSGDIVKALACGADACMSGNLFAGCDETPGEIIDGFKHYQGMASRRAQEGFKGLVNNSMPEGVDRKVKAKGPVKNIMQQLAGGIRSGLSYSGAHNLFELRNNAEFQLVTQNGHTEGLPHGLFSKEF
jgi:IMP dehydrogenase